MVTLEKFVVNHPRLGNCFAALAEVEIPTASSLPTGPVVTENGAKVHFGPSSTVAEPTRVVRRQPR